jgi:hypothetical protein
MHWKYEADKNLVKRDAFKWTIVRPGGLTNNSGTGKADIGRTHLGKTISVSLLLSSSTLRLRSLIWCRLFLERRRG